MFIYKAANSTTFFLRKRGVNAKNIVVNHLSRTIFLTCLNSPACIE